MFWLLDVSIRWKHGLTTPRTFLWPVFLPLGQCRSSLRLSFVRCSICRLIIHFACFNAF